MYGKKLPSLILKKTNRLTQAVGFFRRHFLCGVLLCNCSSAERGGLFRHNTCTTGIFTRTLYAQHPVSLRIFPCISPRFSPTIFYRDANSILLRSHLCTACSKLYAQNPLCSKLFKKVCTTGISSRILNAQHRISRIFPSLQGSRLRLFIARQIQHSTVHSF